MPERLFVRVSPHCFYSRRAYASQVATSIPAFSAPLHAIRGFLGGAGLREPGAVFSYTVIMRQAPKKPKGSSLLTRNDDKTDPKSKTPTLSRFRKLHPHQHTPSRNRTATTRCYKPLLAATDVP